MLLSSAGPMALPRSTSGTEEPDESNLSLADHLACDVKVVNRIVNGRTSVTAEMVLKLGATFRTTPEFWLNAQKAVDLHHVARRLPGLTGTAAASRLTARPDALHRPEDKRS